jgi:hypothetical protein
LQTDLVNPAQNCRQHNVTSLLGAVRTLPWLTTVCNSTVVADIRMYVMSKRNHSCL